MKGWLRQHLGDFYSLCFTLSICWGSDQRGTYVAHSVYIMPFIWNWGLSGPCWDAIASGKCFAIGPIHITVQL